MPRRTLNDVVSKQVKGAQPKDSGHGIVLSVGLTLATVRVKGASGTQDCYFDPRNPPSSGDQCALARPLGSDRWIITSSYVTPRGGRGLGTGKPADFELAPPADIHDVQAVPGAILAAWNAPPQQAVTFEVQTNFIADEDEASTVLKTRGSYAVIPSVDALFVRVRSITSDFHYSSWSAWTSMEPAPPAAGGGSSFQIGSILISEIGEVLTDGTNVLLNDAAVGFDPDRILLDGAGNVLTDDVHVLTDS